MKANSDKSHLLLSCSEPSTALGGSSVESSTEEILLGIAVDRDLKFDDHIKNLCKKAWEKLSVLACLAPFMNVDKKE